MSSGKGEKKSWTDTEKVGTPVFLTLIAANNIENALLVALIASAGSPDWSKVVLPAGRSKQACYHQYMAAMKSAEGIDKGGPPAVIKRRGPRKPIITEAAATTGTSKRKRGQNSTGVPAENRDDEEVEAKAKKIKELKVKVKTEFEKADSEGDDGQGEPSSEDNEAAALAIMFQDAPDSLEQEA